jgi:hypothetical protein
MPTFKFDKGPTASWAQKFFDAPRQYHVDHPSGRFRTEFGPVYYRGRLNGRRNRGAELRLGVLDVPGARSSPSRASR